VGVHGQVQREPCGLLACDNINAEPVPLSQGVHSQQWHMSGHVLDESSMYVSAAPHDDSVVLACVTLCTAEEGVLNMELGRAVMRMGTSTQEMGLHLKVGVRPAGHWNGPVYHLMPG
jgi:hypothetical protein